MTETLMSIAEMKELDDPVVIVDQVGFIREVNAAFTERFGWTRPPVGTPLISIIPAHMHDAHNVGFARFLASEQPRILGQALQLPVLDARGETVDAEVYIVGERTDAKWTFAAWIRPTAG